MTRKLDNYVFYVFYFTLRCYEEINRGDHGTVSQHNVINQHVFFHSPGNIQSSLKKQKKKTTYCDSGEIVNETSLFMWCVWCILNVCLYCSDYSSVLVQWHTIERFCYSLVNSSSSYCVIILIWFPLIQRCEIYLCIWPVVSWGRRAEADLS